MELKCKIVSFRLSASEYSEAEQVCRAHGYSSLSLFARSAIMAFLSSPTNARTHESEINELRERIDVIAAEVLRISEQIRNEHARAGAA